MSARVKVIFIKAHFMNGLQWKVGSVSKMRIETATELIDKKIVKEFTGGKTKINLKDLK